jgi:hypothetical protein
MIWWNYPISNEADLMTLPQSWAWWTNEEIKFDSEPPLHHLQEPNLRKW